MAIRELIFMALAACCGVLFFYQVVRKMRPEVTIERIVATGLVGAWLILVLVFVCVWETPADAPVVWCGLLLAASIPLGLIWFGDELGGLTGFHHGLVNRQSPGFLVRLLGWLILLGLVGGSVAAAVIDMLNAP